MAARSGCCTASVMLLTHLPAAIMCQGKKQDKERRRAERQAAREEKRAEKQAAKQERMAERQARRSTRRTTDDHQPSKTRFAAIRVAPRMAACAFYFADSGVGSAQEHADCAGSASCML